MKKKISNTQHSSDQVDGIPSNIKKGALVGAGTCFIICTIIIISYWIFNSPTIDASSEETIKKSVQKVRESLPETKREEFDEAIRLLTFSQIDELDIISYGFLNTGKMEQVMFDKVRQAVDGKTSNQIISEAQQIRTEREQEQREQALAEIRELETKQAKSQKSREQIKTFQVLRSRFYLKKEEFSSLSHPIIDITVKNDTAVSVSRAYFEGTLASPNRSVPWHKDTFNYIIPGGLEPGEVANWNLAPNMFSGWGRIEFPADAVFTVTVKQIDGPDGEIVYSAMDFSEHDQERLNELKKQYGVN